MKISLDWIGDHVDLPGDLSVDRIAHDLTMTTVEVEAAVDLAAEWDGLVVGRVLGVDSLKTGKTLHLTSCDVGGRTLQIVCGARHVKPGMAVAVALPGASIRPLNAAEPRRIKVAEVGGVRSEGVLCAAGELGLTDLFPPGDEHSILDLSGLEVTPGQPLASAIGWRDRILEIDNKSLTNRPDLWGHLGIARELAAIYRLPLRPLPVFDRQLPPAALVGDVDEKACARFAALRVSDARMEESPFWLRSRLARIGQRPRNLYVDLTNYVMFAVGQPSHAYDARSLRLPLRARLGVAGERVELLDGREQDLDLTTCVIADGARPLALAGIIGGADTAVTAETREVVLEIATFDALSVRRTATRLGLRTEASSRFEKGLDTARVDQALASLVSLLGRIQPSARITGFADMHPRPTRGQTIEVAASFLQQRLGEPLSSEVITEHLVSVGFEVRNAAERLQVTVPTWRSTGDVTSKHDLVEEVARLHGYENFKFVPPTIRLTGPALNRRALMMRRLREILAFTGGLQEIVTYPWVKDDLLDAAGLAGQAPLRLATPPAPDQSYLRPSLVPGLLAGVTTNLRYSSSFRIFEMGRVFPAAQRASLDDPRETLPPQPYHLGAALVGADAQSLIMAAKGLIETIRRAAHVASLGFAPQAEARWADAASSLGIVAGDRRIGSVGVLSSRARRLADIKRGVVVLFEMRVDELEPLASRENGYRPLPEYPEISSDLSLLFPEDVTWASITEALRGLPPLVREVTFVDQFRGEKIPVGKKSVTLRLLIGSPSRTLRSEEVAEITKLAVTTLGQSFGAELRT